MRPVLDQDEVSERESRADHQIEDGLLFHRLEFLCLGIDNGQQCLGRYIGNDLDAVPRKPAI